MNDNEPPEKALPESNIVIPVIEEKYADLARSSLDKTIEKITQTSETFADPFIGLEETRESSQARQRAINILRSKMPEILHRLGVKADNVSLTIGPTLYFTGKYTRIYYPHKSVVCTLAFGHHRDSQVPEGDKVPELKSGWGCCWAGPRYVEWKGSGGGIGAIVTVSLTSSGVTASSAS